MWVFARVRASPGHPSSLYDAFLLAIAVRDARLKVAPQDVPNSDMMFVTSSAGGAAGTGSDPYLTKSS
jgi:cell division GTPase FtsZ